MALRDAGAPPKQDEAPKRRFGRGVWIRLAIYIPLLGYFGARAGIKANEDREAADEAFRAAVGEWLEHPPRTIVLPNGETMPVYEITEEEAAALGLVPERADDEAAKSDAAKSSSTSPSTSEPTAPTQPVAPASADTAEPAPAPASPAPTQPTATQ